MNLPLPPEYVPFPRLMICSNTFTNGRVPINMRGHAPFLIGMQEGMTYPLVWLSRPADSTMRRWTMLVDRNLVKDKRLFLDKFAGNAVEIRTLNLTVLSVVQDNPGSATIDRLDLRPIGVLVHGDERTGLVVGTNTLRANSFTNVDTMIGVGEQQGRRDSPPPK
jgi:hypothetical protein